MLGLPSALCPQPGLPRATSLGGAGAPWVTFGISDLCLPSLLSPPSSLKSCWKRAEGTGRWDGGTYPQSSLPEPARPPPLILGSGIPHLSLLQPQYVLCRNQNHPS